MCLTPSSTIRWTAPDIRRKTDSVLQVRPIPFYLLAALLVCSCSVTQHTVFEKNTGQNPLFDSHRGLQPFAPENTLASFEAAGKAGQWAIETDFRLSADSVVMCIHDAKLKRTTGAEGLVSDCTFSELRRLKCLAVNSSGVRKLYDYESIPESKLRIPTMDEYFRICRRYGSVAFIELKEGGVIGQMNNAIRKYRMQGRCVISSGNRKLLQEYRDSGGTELIHLIFGKEEDIPWLVSLGNAAIAFNYKDYTNPDLPRLVELCHGKGLKVCFRAVDTPEDVKRSINLGVDYMPTNNMYKEILK